VDGVRLTYGGLAYWDRTLALLDGQVRPAGIDLRYQVHTNAPALFSQQIQEQTYDVAEMSMASYLLLLGQGDDRFIGLPVFLSRNFRHSQVYVSRDSGIHRPQDLLGCTVGVLEYQMTAAVWIRGILQDEYGVRPADLRWRTGGLTSPAWAERLAWTPPADLELERIPRDRFLEEMLASGELDALVTAQPPQGFDPGGSGPVRRLFTDYRSVERDYFARTRNFPIMHLVTMRRDVHDRYPWAAASLTAAFDACKQAGRRRLRAITGLAVGVPWLGADLDEVDELFGGDAFPYGVDANRSCVLTLARYAHEQGLTPAPVALTRMFPAELL
jgi:4,5-dihydroxyphthalate decarboxylase